MNEKLPSKTRGARIPLLAGVAFLLIAIVGYLGFFGKAKPVVVPAKPPATPVAVAKSEPLPAKATTPSIPDKNDNKLQAIQTLNYTVVALTHIISYNDKVVLDQEYDELVNNLNLTQIPDEEALSLFSSLMDLLTKSKINDTERRIVERQYERNVSNALTKSMTSAVSSVQYTANPMTSIASGLFATGTAYFNYREQIEQYEQERDAGTWQIEKDILTNLNQYRTDLLTTSWRLLDKYDIPDKWRLTEGQLQEYQEILKDEDKKRRLARLVRIEKDFQMYPPYWYYRGRAAQELENDDEALRCFEYFDAHRMPIHRKDGFAASVAMCRAMLDAKKSRPVDPAQLEVIVDNSQNKDWSNLLFAAVKYAELGKAEEARELVMRNVDNGHNNTLVNFDVAEELLPKLLDGSAPEATRRIMEGILKSDTLNNFDVLYLYGAMRNEDVLLNLSREFSGINLFPVSNDSWFQRPTRWLDHDGFILTVPPRWLPSNLASELSIAQTPDSGAVVCTGAFEGKDEAAATGTLVFRNAISLKEVGKGSTSIQATIELKRDRLPTDRNSDKAYSLKLVFVSALVSAEEAHTWWDIINKGMVDAAVPPAVSLGMMLLPSDETKQKAVIFKRSQIVLNGEVFPWSDEQGIVLK
jgi:hypothetical protein